LFPLREKLSPSGELPRTALDSYEPSEPETALISVDGMAARGV
jgi:hypothetical protein